MALVSFQTKEDVGNAALEECNEKPINTWELEETNPRYKSADCLKRNYQAIVGSCLAERDWSFARKGVQIAPLEEPRDGLLPQYKHAYLLPDDYVAHIFGVYRHRTKEIREGMYVKRILDIHPKRDRIYDYDPGHENVLYVNDEGGEDHAVWVIYTGFVTPNLWRPNFAEWVIQLLVAKLAITLGNGAAKRTQAMELAELAHRRAVNENKQIGNKLNFLEFGKNYHIPSESMGYV